MDKVRFGRALGMGAREAAKMAMRAADAARAPDPSAGLKAAETVRAEPRRAATVSAKPRRTAQVGTQAKALGKSVWNPLARFSGVLWLEVTGFFFGVFAFGIGRAAWKLRPAITGGHPPEWFYFDAALCVLFAYFAVSSFVKAGRRQKR